MSESANVGQFVQRFVNLIDLELAIKVSKKFVADQARIAWDNDWREHKWLAKEALMGTRMGNVENPAALFTAQLREAAATKCERERTSLPPSIAEVRAEMNSNHQPSTRVSQWADQCRGAMRGTG